MAGCRIVNESVVSAVQEMNNISQAYQQAGETLISALTSAGPLSQNNCMISSSAFVNFCINL